MKKIIRIILAIVIILGVLPYFVGSQSEDHFKKIIKLSNQNPTFIIEIKEYNKGWFTSVAEVEFKLNIAIDPDFKDMPTLVFVQEMQHGPVLWNTSGIGFGLMDTSASIELPQEWQEAIDTIDSIDDNTLSIKSRTAFDGSTKTYLDIAAVNFDDEKMLFTIHPTTAIFNYTLEGKITGHLDWQGLDVTELDKKALEVGAMSVKFDQQLIKGKLFSSTAIYSGSFDSTVKNITLTPNDPISAVLIDDLAIKASTAVKDNLIDINFSFEIASIKAMAMTFTHFVQDISILNIDMDVMQEFTTIINEIQVNSQTEQALSDDEMKKKMHVLLNNALINNPIFKLNELGIETEAGRISTQMDISINSELYDVNNPDSLSNSVVVNASGHAPEAFFTGLGFSAMVNPLIEQNMIIREGELLTFKFNFVEGKGSLNGKLVPIPSL